MNGACEQEERLEKLEDINPDIEKRLTIVERDLNGNGEFGIRKKINILWTKHLKNKEVEDREKIAWDKISQLFLAFLQSGLLVYLISRRG